MAVRLHEIFLGEVAAVHNYGAFVRIPNAGRTQGLVHKSQISLARVDDATEVLEQNEKVWCKVISIVDDKKIGLSMKVVDQGTGSDLDPNGVQISLDEQQRKAGVSNRETSAITLEAVLKTKCSKCGVSGHLSKNCFQTPEGKSYELIPEPEPEKKIFGTAEDRLKRLADAGVSDRQSDKQKKKKKKRKKSISDSDTTSKKKKKSSRKYDSSSSTDGSLVANKKRKKKSKSHRDKDKKKKK